MFTDQMRDAERDKKEFTLKCSLIGRADIYNKKGLHLMLLVI